MIFWLHRVKLRNITCSLPGLHVCQQQCCREDVCLTYSVCKTTALRGKVWWKGLHCLDGISVHDQAGASFPLYVLSSCMCLLWHCCLAMLRYCLPFCLVLSALPVLGCCVSPYFRFVKSGGQRLVGFGVSLFSWVCFFPFCIVTEPGGFSSGVRESLWPSQDYKLYTELSLTCRFWAALSWSSTGGGD